MALFYKKYYAVMGTRNDRLQSFFGAVGENITRLTLSISGAGSDGSGRGCLSDIVGRMAVVMLPGGCRGEAFKADVLATLIGRPRTILVGWSDPPCWARLL